MWYSQNDPRWQNERLGLMDGVTIGADGCYTTAQTNLANDCGKDINVAQLDQKFTDNMSDPYNLGGYVDQGLCWDGMLSKIFPDIQFAGVDNYPPGTDTDLSKLNNDVTVKQILEVDGQPNTPGLQTHFVYFYDYNPSTGVVRIVDSWTGLLVSLNQVYGNPKDVIYKIISFTFNPPKPQVQAPPPAVDPAPVLPPAHDPVATETAASNPPADPAPSNVGVATTTITPDPVKVPVAKVQPQSVGFRTFIKSLLAAVLEALFKRRS